ncbi:MAG: phosphoribosylanthranilate isomerase [Planctomycetota bacterium]|nr:phosphoribosylanthranilate isomerase [Planctomycetota bacterium]MDA1142487.1 phosphoribosylanthranilate isomerase [Planctomycetota bacterium]
MNCRIKICGITRPQDAELACALGAHAVGLIFAESPRQVSRKQAQAIVRELPPFITPVGVFVNEPVEELMTTVEKCGLGAVQLHGDETPEYARQLEGISVIKAISVRDASSFEGLDLYQVHAFLLDTFSKERRGGTGYTFNWELAVHARLARPVILSGGLKPENIREAIQTVQPYGVDISSGVEAEPGVKDEAKMRALFEEIAGISK